LPRIDIKLDLLGKSILYPVFQIKDINPFSGAIVGKQFRYPGEAIRDLAN
jgi:hypothetical protein